ncbi:sensor histidine kinase [Natroniella sp. ANB-PHB2]|uniref:sensor histidine kinase n=1 Tax=Natroniella sp. ANB-PHB2 TaxID=3384444 RepID=UPI0038D48F29
MLKHKFRSVIIILLMQSFLLLVLTLWRNLNIFEIVSINRLIDIILFIAVGLSILSVIAVKELFKLNQHQIEMKLQRLKLDENQKLVKNLKSQKHDFSNHLQTLYGMIQLGKKEEAKEYIKSLSQDLRQLKYSQSDLAESILDSLLLPKKMKAIREGIRFEYQIESGVEEVNLSLNQLFRVIGNLVDNAFDALEGVNGQKEIEIVGVKQGVDYFISVCNTGSIIDEELLDKIFMPGFSTKGEGRGFGLYIIKSLIEDAGGELTVRSEQDLGTEFSIRLPIKGQSDKNT